MSHNNQSFGWSGALVAFMLASVAHANTIKVMMLHNSQQSNAGWKEGFYDFFAPFLNGQGGFTMSDGNTYTLDTILCEESLDTNAVAKVQACVNTAVAQNVDAIIVGTSSSNDDIKTAAEAVGIPNIHCSGGNPMSWTAATPHAFGMHLPFPWYSRGPIRQAALLNLKTVVIMRNYEPLDLEADTMPSFYEIAESKVHEVGFDPRAEFISPGIVEFIEGVIDDVRSQGADPDMVVNWLTAARTGQFPSMEGTESKPNLQAFLNQFKGRVQMRTTRMKKFGYKMYFGGPNGAGTAWYGYESYWNNGTAALGKDEALYNTGGGQWHYEMGFSDPYFGTTASMVSQFETQFAKVPSYDHAACMAAGISLSFGLQKYGQSLVGLSTAQRREEVRVSVGTLNDETLFGMVRFNRFNQNNGRMSVNWQVLEDGNTRSAATQFRFPSPSWDARIGCPAGTYATGLLPVPTECVACPEGRARSTLSMGLNFSECDLCPEGYGTLPGQTGLLECPACPAGRYQNGNSDRGVCNACPLGTSRAANSIGGCILCAAQTYADVTGLETCKACPSKSSQSDLGQTFCFCDVGAYKDPADVTPVGTVLPCLGCEQVIPGSTTLYPNSRYSHECVCPAKTFWHRPDPASSVAFCKECGLGLVCLGGRESAGNNGSVPNHQAPLQAQMYAAGAPAYNGGDPSYIVECGSTNTCPGDLALGDCPGNNVGIACVDCAADHYSDNGLCYSCADAGFALGPLLAALALFLVALVGLYKFATKMDKPHRDSMMTVTIGAGLVLATLQALSAFSKVEVQWVEPLQTLRGIFSFLIFDISILRPGCFLGTMNPLLNYLGSLLMYPIAATGIMLCFAFGKYVLKKNITLNEVVNAQGLIVSAVYIALTSLAVRPFQCVGNPDGTSSMTAYRNVICWRDAGHSWMVALSFLPFFGGVCTFMALVIWAVIQYPVKVSSPNGVKFVKRYKFIFSRFSPDAYYFALVLNFRNFLIGILPVLLVAYNELQFLSLTLVIAVYALLQARMWPWRTLISNLMDACLALFLGTTVVSVILMIGTVVAFVGLVVAFSFAAYRTYRPSRTYGIFLSHHKLGAAVLSRWFKMLLGEHTTSKIFLDSDDVSKLDAIIDVTAWDCENVVVLITQETLKRMWCAALDRKGANGELHQKVAKDVIAQCKGLSTNMLSRLAMGLKRADSGLSTSTLLMLGDLVTPEAGSCCRVIQSLLQSKLQEPVHVVDPTEAIKDLDAAATQMGSAKVILVILTQGVLHEPTFAGTVAACPEGARANFVPIKADESFIYPDPTFWENLADGKIFSEKTLDGFDTDFEGVRAAYARLFNVLALKFTSHGSESIQGTEIQVMTGRLAPMIDDASAKTDSVRPVRSGKADPSGKGNVDSLEHVLKEPISEATL
ncbi:unnamed protein product [Durusdinium trenchii]|uniref:EGF and pentraxin domain-containing protein 1 n=2 Tax=Durusdinium trenchii TaxID=1381693 RepID=A0ABP0QHM1_9DINO